MATDKESEIRILHSQDAGATPDAALMEYGELAINIADDKLYYKNGANSLGFITNSSGSGGGTAAIPALNYTYKDDDEAVTTGTFRIVTSASAGEDVLEIHTTDADGTSLESFFNKFGSFGTIYLSDVNTDPGRGVYTYELITDVGSNKLQFKGDYWKVLSSVSSGDSVNLTIAPTRIKQSLPPGNRYLYDTRAQILNTNDDELHPLVGDCVGRGDNGDPNWIGPLASQIGSIQDFDFGYDGNGFTLDEDLEGNNDVQEGFYIDQFFELQNNSNLGFIRITDANNIDKFYVGSCIDLALLVSKNYSSGTSPPRPQANLLNWYVQTLYTTFEQADTTDNLEVVFNWSADNPYAGVNNANEGFFSTGETSDIYRPVYQGQTAGSLGTGDIAISGSHPNYSIQISNTDNSGNNRYRRFINDVPGKIRVDDIALIGTTSGISGGTGGGTGGEELALSRAYYHVASVTSDNPGPTGSMTFLTDYKISGGLSLDNVIFGSTYAVSLDRDANEGLRSRIEDVGVVGSLNGLTGDVTLNAGTNVTLTTAAAGITIDGEITDSYTGHIEVVANKDYYLDARSPATRTITEFYVIAGNTGGGTAELKGTNGSIASVPIGVTGATGTLSNTTLPAGGTLEIGVTAGELSEDLRFSVKYTQ